MDKAKKVVDALESATTEIEKAANDIVKDAIEAGNDGEAGAKFTLDTIGDSLRAVETTLKGLADDIKTLKGTYKGGEDKEENETENKEEEDNAVDFIPPEIDDSPSPPEKERRGIRARHKKRKV